MTGLWARLTGAFRSEEKAQAVELSEMSPAERKVAEEGPFGGALDQEVEDHFGGGPEGPVDPDDPDGPDKLLSGPGS